MSDNLRILELFNNHFPDFKFESHQIEFSPSKKIINILDRPRGGLEIDMFAEFVDSIYFNKSEKKYLYHYLSIEYLEKIIEDNKIRLYNLSKYVKNKNDPREYSYFIDRIGDLIPNAEKYLAAIIKDIFIISCTSEKESTEHWNYYGKQNAACICFSLEIKNNYDAYDAYDVDVRTVVYESELTKLFCLQQCIKEEFGYSLDLSKTYQFSKFVKRSYYEWEKEVRICFDNNAFQIGKKLESFLTNGEITKSKNDIYFEIKEDELKNKYIEVPLKNDFFELKIESIQLKNGKCNGLKNICSKKGIQFIE